MHGIILLYLFSFAIGFHMNRIITSSVIVRRRSTKATHSKIENKYDKYNKCHYVNSLFSNTCPRQPFDGYKNLYDKSYQMELLEFQGNECFRKPNLFGIFSLVFVIIIGLINCLF
jgi:hypothetical protein